MNSHKADNFNKGSNEISEFNEPQLTTDNIKSPEADSIVPGQSINLDTPETVQPIDQNTTTTDIFGVTNFTNSEIIDAIDFLKNCQNIAVETAKIGIEIGRGSYGVVFEATAQFLGKAIQLVKKGFFYPKMGANELYVQYRILQYVTEHYDELFQDPFWAQSVNSLALALLSKEQNRTLSQAKSPKELMEKINSMINDVSSSMRTAMEEVLDPTEQQEIQNNFPKEVNNGFFLQFKPGKSLENDPDFIINNCSAENRGKAFQGILSSACLLDRIGIIHRDIRGANIQVNISPDNIPSTALLDPGIGLDAQNLDVYDETDKTQKKLKYLKSIHCSPPEAFPDGLEKGWEPTDSQNAGTIFNPETYNAYGVGTVLPSIYYGKDGQDMIDSYFLTFEKYAQHLSASLVNSAEQIVNQLPDKEKVFGEKFQNHAKKLSEVVNRNPLHLAEDYLDQIRLQFKQLPPEQAKKISNTLKEYASSEGNILADFYENLDEDVKKIFKQLAKSSFEAFKEKFFSYFPTGMDKSRFLSEDSKYFLQRKILSKSDILVLLPDLIEKNSIDTKTVEKIYLEYGFYDAFKKKFGNLGFDLTEVLKNIIKNDKKHLTEVLGEKDDKISEFNELFSDAFLFYETRQNAWRGSKWDQNGEGYNRAKVWLRKQYIAECEENFKNLNSKLQGKSIEPSFKSK